MSTKEIPVTGTTVLRLDESQAWAHWFAVDTETGASYDTGTAVFTDARRIAFDRGRKTTRPAVRYEIVGGPERARAGHQRFPRAHHFE